MIFCHGVAQVGKSNKDAGKEEESVRTERASSHKSWDKRNSHPINCGIIGRTACSASFRQQPMHSGTYLRSQVDASTCHAPTAITELPDFSFVRVRSISSDDASTPSEHGQCGWCHLRHCNMSQGGE